MTEFVIDIAGRKVGQGQPCFIVAEAGVNPAGSPETAHTLIDAAHQAGADAIKFQTFKADRVVVPDAPMADYQKLTTDPYISQFDLLRMLELPYEAHRELFLHCQELGLLFFSTPFDSQSADMLDALGVEVFKIASGEITNYPFLEHIATKQKPIIVSTGASTLDEVEAAVSVLRSAGNIQIAVLHCVSNYPADPTQVNLRAMDTLANRLRVPVGFSDHTLGMEMSLVAVARGATIIEKHITLNKQLPGPDHQASMEFLEFSELVRKIRTVESALGDGIKQPTEQEAPMVSVIRRSLVAAEDIPAGTRLTEQHIAILRPGTGLPPKILSQILGRETKQNIRSGTLINLEMLL